MYRRGWPGFRRDTTPRSRLDSRRAYSLPVGSLQSRLLVLARPSPGGTSRCTAGVGLDFVEIPLLDPGSIVVEHTRSLLDRYSLGCSCSLGLPPEVHLDVPPGLAWISSRYHSSIPAR